MSQNPSSDTSVPSQVTCLPAKDPAVRYFLMAALLIGVGIWCWMERNKYPDPGQWSWNNPGRFLEFYLDNYGSFVLVPAGVVAAGYAARFLRRKLTADGEGIGYEGETKIAWGAIQELDATKLTKGFLYLKHGEGKALTLDSWKLQGFRPMVAFIEQHVPANCPKRT